VDENDVTQAEYTCTYAQCDAVRHSSDETVTHHDADNAYDETGKGGECGPEYRGAKDLLHGDAYYGPHRGEKPSARDEHRKGRPEGDAVQSEGEYQQDRQQDV